LASRAREIIPINPLKAELNPICHLLALLGAHPILHVSRIRVNMTGDATRAACSKDLKYGLRICFNTEENQEKVSKWSVVGPAGCTAIFSGDEGRN
jgi:hypothetical protein